MLQRSDIKPVILPILAVFMLAFFAVYFLGGYDQAEAEWTGPDPNYLPPGDNVERPLRIDTEFAGHITGKYDSLTLNGSDTGLNCTSSDSIIWDGEKEEFICDTATSNSNLLDVLNNGADASGFIGGVTIGDLTSEDNSWLDLGGPLTAKWLHATSTEGESVIAHDLAIGGNVLTSNDIFFADGKSLRIDQSETTTSLFVGNYADGLGFSHFDGVKANLFVEGLVDADSLCINGNCVDNFNNLGGAAFKQLSATASNGNVGGYGGANSKCPAGMHVCTMEEILNTINQGLMPEEVTGFAWVSAGAPGHISTGNDCSGWTNGTEDYMGRAWSFTNSFGTMAPCQSSAKFACCQ